MYQFQRDKSSAVYLLNNIVSIDDEDYDLLESS